VRPQQGQPTEDMGIAAQLMEGVNLRILSAEISPPGEAVTDSAAGRSVSGAKVCRNRCGLAFVTPVVCL